VKLLPVRRLTVEQSIRLRCCRVCGLEQEQKKERQRAVWASDDAVTLARCAGLETLRGSRVDSPPFSRAQVFGWRDGGSDDVWFFFDCVSMYGIGVSTFHGLRGRADSRVIATWRCCVARADGAI
jgi:hypothetical protein